MLVNKIVVWCVFDEDEKEVLEKFVENLDNVYGFGYIFFFRDVIEVIKSGKDLFVIGEEGKKLFEIIFGIYKLVIEKRLIKLLFINFLIIDMKKFYER